MSPGCEAHFNFQRDDGPASGVDRMASGQGGSRVWPRFNFRVARPPELPFRRFGDYRKSGSAGALDFQRADGTP